MSRMRRRQGLPPSLDEESSERDAASGSIAQSSAATIIPGIGAARGDEADPKLVSRRRGRRKFHGVPRQRAVIVATLGTVLLAWVRFSPSQSMSRALRNATESLIPGDRFLSREEFLSDFGRPKYNGLDIRPLPENAYARAIAAQDQTNYERERRALLAAVDAGREGRQRLLKYEDYAQLGERCRRNNWRDRIFENCLTFHETSVLDRTPRGAAMHDFDVTYTGHGYFRDSWIYRHGSSGDSADDDDGFVLKKMRLVDDFDYDEGMIYQMHREAIVMERLTASPRIVDIFGYCSTSIMSEIMIHEVTNDIIPDSLHHDNVVGWIRQPELDKLQTHDVRPMNNLTNEEKLRLAIVMTESIAEIHGYVEGVIVHGDIHPVQWLSNAKGEVKLNDFNNGEILEYDVDRQEYCKVYRCYGGFYRSPEEFRCIDSHEGMDTYSMANNIYTLLTGLWPYYQYKPNDYDFIQGLLINNTEKPYVDPRYRTRSAIEAGLVKAMEKAWEWDLDKRESIFELLQDLYDVRDSLADPK